MLSLKIQPLHLSDSNFHIHSNQCSNTRGSHKTMPQNAPQWKGRASREQQKSAQRCLRGLQAYRPVRAERREVEQRIRMAWVTMLWASVHSALWVGVLGWWRPMVLHIHPAKSTSSTSARLMNVWPCKLTSHDQLHHEQVLVPSRGF